MRTVGERHFALYVILLLGFMFSLTGYPFCLPLSLPLIGTCEKVMRPAQIKKSSSDIRKQSNWQFNSNKFKIVSDFYFLSLSWKCLFWLCVECILITSLCVNNRLFLSICVQTARDATILPHICHTEEFIVKGLWHSVWIEESV